MTDPRVFISHSTLRNGPDDEVDEAGSIARQYVETIDSRLRRADYRVLLDEKDLELGRDWHAELERWIGQCHAAVVLLSERALRSHFVAHEVSLLAARARGDESFVLIPVFIDPVEDAHVRASATLSPSRIWDFQSITKEVTRNTAAAQIVDRLRDELNVPVDTLAGCRLATLETALRKASEQKLRTEAARLGLTAGGWLPGDHRDKLATKLALFMLERGLDDDVRDVLLNIRSELGDTTAAEEKPVRNLIDIVGSEWIPPDACCEIPPAAKAARHVGANAKMPLTAHLYVVRSCHLAPCDGWSVAITDARCDGTVEGLEQLIRSALAKEYQVEPDEVDEEVASDVDGLGKHVFVALPAQGIDGTMVDELRTRLSGVTLFLLTDAAPSDADAERLRLTYLQPELRPDLETEKTGAYVTKKKAFMRRYTS